MPATVNLPGVIEPNVMYQFNALGHVAGWGEAARRAAIRNGLRVRYSGGRGFVRGRDLIDYIDQHGDEVHKAAKQA